MTAMHDGKRLTHAGMGLQPGPEPPWPGPPPGPPPAPLDSEDDSAPPSEEDIHSSDRLFKIKA